MRSAAGITDLTLRDELRAAERPAIINPALGIGTPDKRRCDARAR